jgi:hypothetical protein
MLLLQLLLQAEEQAQKLHQDKMKEVLSNIKDVVVKLESEKLPAKKEELKRFSNENRDDNPNAGFIMVKPNEAGIDEVVSSKVPDSKPIKKPSKPAVKKEFELDEGKTGFGYAVKDGVILWQFPSKDSDVLEILVGWQQLVLLGKTKNQNITWWKARTREYTGFVNAKFVIISD